MMVRNEMNGSKPSITQMIRDNARLEAGDRTRMLLSDLGSPLLKNDGKTIKKI